MAKTKVLITVKTYPTVSAKYDELVCTAGVKENGKWIRIYPVPFRKLDYAQQYPKYQWVEIDLVKNESDFRPESFRPRDINATDFIVFGEKVGTENKWAERKRIILQNVYTDLTELISEAKDKEKATSLAIFKPTLINDFIFKSIEREWSLKQQAVLKQGNLFEQGNSFEVVRKLPYKFSYIFEDSNGRESTLMIEDWETGMLYWNCLKRYNGDEKAACDDVKKKYFDDFAKTKDLYFFLGTTKKNHFVGKNPFLIIGTFHPVPDKQLSMEL